MISSGVGGDEVYVMQRMTGLKLCVTRYEKPRITMKISLYNIKFTLNDINNMYVYSYTKGIDLTYNFAHSQIDRI